MIWIPSCDSNYESFEDTFTFKLTKGVPGNCPGDIKPEADFKFKERNEVRSELLDKGKYIWSANIKIVAKELLHAEVFYLWQVHNSTTRGDSPANFKVVRGMINLRDNKTDINFNLEDFNLLVEITIDKRKNVFCKYFVDQEFIGESKYLNKPKLTPYIKFGAYRWNSICDVTYKYKNVKFERV